MGDELLIEHVLGDSFVINSGHIKSPVNSGCGESDRKNKK